MAAEGDRPVSNELATALRAALDRHRAGDLERAEQLYRTVLRDAPDDPQALHLLGLLARQTGRDAEALELFDRAVAANPDARDVQIHRADLLLDSGDDERARLAYDAVLARHPDAVEALVGRAAALRAARRGPESIADLRRALQLEPTHAAAWNNLGNALRDRGESEEAIGCFRRALEVRPGLPEAANNLGAMLLEQRRAEAAIDCFRAALGHRPAYADAWSNLSIALQSLGRHAEALECCERALGADPRHVAARVNLAQALGQLGRDVEAETAYAAALEQDPTCVAAQWGRCMAELHAVEPDEAAIAASRQRYAGSLERLVASIDLDDRRTVSDAWRAVGTVQPFLLAYHGLDDRELQRTYGTLVARIASARHASVPAQRGNTPRRSRIRVGFVSGYFRSHSNWKMPLRGWLVELDRRRFEVHAYHTGAQSDSCTDEARAAADQFVEQVSEAELRRRLLDDRLDVLVYPEIGMDPVTLRLAAQRLAPVQCTSWGHPVTSGLPTIDSFLSSELMEPPDGDRHYTETLVRLPGLSICYEPAGGETEAGGRVEFGLPESATLVLCAQSLPKYLPRHDDVFVRIARGATAAHLVFLAGASPPPVVERFRERLHRAFAAAGLQVDERLTILPRLPAARYRALNAACDLFLDAIGWSGCNSTMEALEQGLPVLTTPGTLMRGRHSAAMLTMIDVEQGIAADPDALVERAIALANDAGARGALARQVVARRARAWGDRESIRGLESFLEAAAARSGRAGSGG